MKKLFALLICLSVNISNAQSNKKVVLTEQEIASIQQSLSVLPFKDVAQVILFLEQKRLANDTVMFKADSVKPAHNNKK